MKKGVLAVLFIFTWLAACDDSDEDDKKNSKADEVQNTVVNGQWRIIHFFDTDADETDNFNGYIFEFDANNVLTATNGSNNYPGIWSVTDNDDSGDDFDDIDFNIAFTNPADFEELSEDWEIISLSAAKIELRHVSGGNGGTDLLTFEKI
jgi:hypothetical protein